MPYYNKSLYGDQVTGLTMSGDPIISPGHLLEERTGWYNEKDSRIKPPEPLWQYMTSQAPQYRYVKTPAQRVYSGYYGTNYTYMFGSEAGTAPEPDWALELRLKIQETSVNLASSVAEWRKTLDGFIFFAKEMRRIKRAIISHRGRRKPLNFCDVSATHLAVHFGIKPVVSDLYDVVQSFNGAQEPVIRVHARAKASEWAKTTGEYISEGQWTSSDYVTCYIQPKTPERHKSIDLGNPIEWTWELIPFSFVIDWALPVGDTLTALFALNSVNILATSVVHKRKFKGEYRYNDSWSPSYKPGTSGSVFYESHSRSVPGTIPLPRPPKFSMTKSLLALQHAVALLHQLRKC